MHGVLMYVKYFYSINFKLKNRTTVVELRIHMYK